MNALIALFRLTRKNFGFVALRARLFLFYIPWTIAARKTITPR